LAGSLPGNVHFEQATRPSNQLPEREPVAPGSGLGLGFLFVPINLVSYVGMPAEKSNSVAGLVNFMRNMGSSVGTSMVTTLIARRSQVHQVYLVANVTPGRPAVASAVAGLSARLAASGVQAELAMKKFMLCCIRR